MTPDERTLVELLTGQTVVSETAGGVRSLALAPAPDEAIPTSIDELTTQVSRTYDLSITAAMQASIPVIGTVSGGVNRRVIVLERSAYKEIVSPGGRNQYGYAIRLGITVNKIDADMKLTLPFLAASAEIGSIEAKWMLQVVGLAGARIDEVAIPPTELNVETFVLAKQSLTALIGAVREATTRFNAELLGVAKTSDELDKEYRRGVGRTYALGRLERGKRLNDAIADLPFGADEMRDTVADFYRDFAGITNPQAQPTDAVRSRAMVLLGGVKAEPR